MRQLEKLTSGKDGGTSEGGVLVAQERITDADAANIDANEKVDASDVSNVDTPKIGVNRGIGKPCAVAIALYRRVFLRQHALHDAQSYGEGADTGQFIAKKGKKKRQQKLT